MNGSFLESGATDAILVAVAGVGGMLEMRRRRMGKKGRSKDHERRRSRARSWQPASN